MLAKDSVQVRLEAGLSFTELSYVLIQALDFQHLHQALEVRAADGRRRPVGQRPAGSADRPDVVGQRADGVPNAFAMAYPLLLRPIQCEVRQVGERRVGVAGTPMARRRTPSPALAERRRSRRRRRTCVVHHVRAGADPGARGGGRVRAGAPGGAARAGGRHHRAGPRGSRRHGTPERHPRQPSPVRPIEDPDILETLHRTADGFGWLHTEAAAGPVEFLVASGLVRDQGRGPSSDRRRWRDGQRPTPSRCRHDDARSDRECLVRRAPGATGACGSVASTASQAARSSKS